MYAPPNNEYLDSSVKRKVNVRLIGVLRRSGRSRGEWPATDERDANVAGRSDCKRIFGLVRLGRVDPGP